MHTVYQPSVPHSVPLQSAGWLQLYLKINYISSKASKPEQKHLCSSLQVCSQIRGFNQKMNKELFTWNLAHLLHTTVTCRWSHWYKQWKCFVSWLSCFDLWHVWHAWNNKQTLCKLNSSGPGCEKQLKGGGQSTRRNFYFCCELLEIDDESWRSSMSFITKKTISRCLVSKQIHLHSHHVNIFFSLTASSFLHSFKESNKG